MKKIRIASDISLPIDAITSTFKLPASRVPGLVTSFYRFFQQPLEGCWKWNGMKVETTCGMVYGRLEREVEGRRIVIGAHRLALVLKLRHELTWDIKACHSCDFGLCVRPDHLFPGTARDNMEDMWTKGRGVKPPIMRGLFNKKATLTDLQVREIVNRKQEPQRVLAEEFGVSQSSIWRFIHGETRSGVSRAEAELLFPGGE